MIHKPTRWLFLVVCLIASTALKLHAIDKQSVWFDEGYSWNAAVQPTLIDSANADATNPPLYYALLHVAVRGWGDSEFALRLFSLLLSMPLIPVAYQLGKRVSSTSRRELGGVFAAALTAFLPLLWWASQEARMYTLMALMVSGAALAWHHLITRPSANAWIILLACELGLLYSHNSAPVIVLWLNLITLLVWVLRRSAQFPDWRIWGVGQGIVIGLWLPYFVTRFLDLGSANSAITSAPQITVTFVYSIWSAFWITPYERAVSGIVSPQWALALAILFAGAVLLVRQARWMVIHVIVLTAGLIAALIVLGNEFHGRYVVMIAPLMVVAFGVALAHIRRIGGVILAAVVGFSVLSIITALDPDSRFRHDDARGIVQHYADTLTESDSVIAWSYADRYELAYYWDRLGVVADRITLPEGTDMAEIVPMLPTSGDIALNVWYTQRADYRGMMGCLLEDGTTTEPETFTTYGMTNLTFRAPTLRAFEMTEAEIPFADEFGSVIRLTEIGALPDDYNAAQALCIPLTFTLDRSYNGELKVAIRVFHSNGEIVEVTDAILATADGRTSESVAPGELLRAFPVVRLTRGTTAGEYRVMMQVYDARSIGRGFLPQMGERSWQFLVLIATWHVQPGFIWQRSDIPYPATPPIAVTDRLIVEWANSPDYPLRNGWSPTLTLIWEGEGDLMPLIVHSVDNAWSITLPPEDVSHVDGGAIIEWRHFQIPPDVASGTAVVQLPDGRELGTFEIEAEPFVSEPPPDMYPLTARIEGYADLLGYRADSIFALDASPRIELIWQALGATPPDQEGATVFVQMLNRDGVVIAQSDMQPATGTRPTTGWRDGEIIVDTHRLDWNALASAGEVTVIAGWYTAQTGERYTWSDGRDHVVIGQFEVR